MKELFLVATVIVLLALQSVDPIDIEAYIGGHVFGFGLSFFALALLTLFAPKFVAKLAHWLVLGGTLFLVLSHADEIAQVVKWGFQ